MTYQGDGAHTSYRDGKGDFKLTEAQVSAAGAQYIGEVVRDSQVFAVIHAHTDQQLRFRVVVKGMVQVMIFQQHSYRSFTINFGNILGSGNSYQSFHFCSFFRSPQSISHTIAITHSP